jgi:SecD/SecF fusion protein
MKNRAFWLTSVIVVLFWSIYNLYPPTGKDVTVAFKERAIRRDATYTNIVKRLNELQKINPDRSFANLVDAVGTNSITNYFPIYSDAGKKENPGRYILNRLQKESAGKIKLGIDLQGGTSFLMAMDTNALALNDTNALVAQSKREVALDQAAEVLRRRVDRFGVAEPIIQPQGANQILVQLPGLSDANKEEALKQIQKAAFLEFRIVHPKSEELLSQGLSEPGYVVMYEEQENANGTKSRVPMLVKKRAERGLTGEYITHAYVTRHTTSGQPIIAFEMNDKGGAIFAQVTTENVGNRLAIILDGDLRSAPVIKTPITGGSGIVEGNFSMKEAQELANVLENPLAAPLKLMGSREVSPSLGKDSIQSGFNASLYGVLAVAVFMLVYYLFGGLVANIALAMNIVVLLGVMCYIRTTLTLPGIAGVVLTIGMAVDANVLIFERIREELAAGKSMRGALQAGYGKAFGTIFDSNLTTLIASITLIFLGTGPVKGFGVALTIGVTVSMFTALVVTRLIFDFLLDWNLLKNMRMLHLVRGANFDFMKWAVAAFVISWSIILVGNGYGLIARGSKVLGPDFAGGDQQVFSFKAIENSKDLENMQAKVREVVTALKVGEPSVQVQKDILTREETLRVITAFNSAELVDKALVGKMPEFNFKSISVARVGPTVGQEITRTAIVATLVAMFGILVYVAFRYEFTFAVGAVIAIVHDILMTLGIFFLSGRELSAPIVAAVLTIIGFSINDTIVIFDRIREDLKLGVHGTFREIMNKALNQTLSRTIITSGTVFLATLSLYLFGGGVVNDFAFTFLVGIVTGTYSSIYIASAIVLWWYKGQRPNIGSSVSMTGPEKADSAAA